MGATLGLPHDATGETLYAVLRNASGEAADVRAGGAGGEQFESYETANLDNYDLPLSEQGTASRYYVLTFPSWITAGVYAVSVYVQSGASPAEGDDLAGWGTVHWDGTSVIELQAVALTSDIPSAAAIRQEIDANSTVLAAIVEDTGTTLPAQIAGLSIPSAAAIRLEIDTNSTKLAAIVEDTGTTLPAQISGLNIPTAAAIRQEIDTNSTQLAAIVTDTDEVQTRLNQMTEDDGGTRRFTANALEQAPGGSTNVTILPLVATVSAGEVSSNNLVAYQGAAAPYTWTIVDDAGDAIDLSAKTLTFTAWDPAETSGVEYQLSTADQMPQIAVSGAGSNLVTVTLSGTETATPGQYQFALRNETDDTMLAVGSLDVREAREPS